MKNPFNSFWDSSYINDWRGREIILVLSIPFGIHHSFTGFSDTN
ncbi:hypothetical protein YN1HA_18190 [Sulfurisphaera ohwakuensis]